MRLFYSFFILLISGCSISPSGLRLSSVRMIDSKFHPELITVNYSNVNHHKFYDGIAAFNAKENHLEEYLQLTQNVYNTNRKANGKPTLEITFNTNVNLMSEYVSQGYTISSEAFYCDGLSRIPNLDYGSVLMRKVDLSETVIISELMTPYAKKYQYQIYLRVKGNGFDLEKHPQDVCFVLNGGRMWRDAYESNTVVIPQDKIEKAIRDGLK